MGDILVLGTSLIIIILLLLPPKVCPGHISFTTEPKLLKFHRNVRNTSIFQIATVAMGTEKRRENLRCSELDAIVQEECLGCVESFFGCHGNR